MLNCNLSAAGDGDAGRSGANQIDSVVEWWLSPIRADAVFAFNAYAISVSYHTLRSPCVRGQAAKNAIDDEPAMAVAHRLRDCLDTGCNDRGVPNRTTKQISVRRG